jgi:hypothetical protein
MIIKNHPGELNHVTQKNPMSFGDESETVSEIG